MYFFQFGEKPNMEIMDPNPHAFLFWRDEDPKEPQCMLIVAGALHYPNINVTTISQAIFNLLAVYYIMHLNYPATSGILNLIDRFCLNNGSPEGSSNKKKKGKKPFQRIASFLDSYNAFMEKQQQ